MDAQNAAESDPPKHAGASPQQQEKQHHRPRQGSGSDPDQKSSSTVRALSPSKEDKPKANQSSSSSSSSSSSVTAARTDDVPAADRDSDAETIVLPGKDGHSPSKVRKVRQEDRSESDGDAGKSNGRATVSTNHTDKPAAGSRPVDGVKGKRLLGSLVDKDRQPRNKDGASSGLSSAPASPPHHQNRQHQHQHPHHRRRSDAAAASLSDSEGSHHRLTSTSLREKLKSGERLLPHKRKAPGAESDDEANQRKARRQRTSSATLDNGRPPKDLKPASSKPSQHDSRTRSISPHQRQHRRSISTQLPSQSSNSLKKKRLPPPLQSTDYHSDESSASGSPHPRNTKLRSLATPATSEPHASPVKMAPHRKHLDAHGQTLLARACARGEYEAVKKRLTDRRDDLNVADYAGNTPLQIAAINGSEDIVKLLIDAGCNLDCVNYDKDTPLLDAVDNGHVGVVKLLLDAGVNPRKANVNGEEPIDRVNEDTENGDEIRTLLLEAKKRHGERRRTSEDRHSHADYHDARDSHAPDSPRHSPAATMSNATGRRAGTVRSTKTRNDLLYMPLDDKTLRQAAKRGDEETVARILQVKEGFDDPESMVAAARGGHDLVLQLLLGLGNANADPGPISSLPAEFATPMLAAIGQENIKVVELLLEQQNFDPTKRFKGETYYEIARRRQGTNWKEEEHMLKNAYDEYKRTHKDIKTKSPGRREREREREEKRAKRDEAKEESRPHKRNASSPSRPPDIRKKSESNRLSSPKDKRRLDASHADDNSQKRGPGRPKKEDRSINLSDCEALPTPSHKPSKPKRTESDVVGVSSEGETVKPRRKLVSKGELKGERERQKRGSMTSNSSGMREPSSPNESRNEESSDKQTLSEKYHDRTKALKRDESKDRLSVSSDATTKRLRTSVTPDRPSDADKDNTEGQGKRRRLDNDSQEKRIQKRSGSVEGKPHKLSSSRDSSSKPSVAPPRKSREEETKVTQSERNAHRKDSGRSSSGEKLVRVKSEDVDLEMPDAAPLKEIPESHSRKAREEEEEQAKKKELAEREEAKKEEERRRARAEEKRQREQEEARLREEEEERKRKRKEQEEREMQRKREEEEARKLREQAERERREAEEAARRQEEEKRRLEEEKRKREEEEKRRKEEEERKQRQEEERLYREQLEREAAEEARRQREEEERKERERRERAHREEMERKRAAREAEQKRIREEQERIRLDKLPPLLRWLSTTPNPKTAVIAEKFRSMPGVRYDTINPEANHTPEGRERWVLNTNVALLLGEKDLELSRYTTWERAPVSELAKKSLWMLVMDQYSLVSEKTWDLGRQLSGYYGDEDISTMGSAAIQHLRQAAWERFLNTDMFFVKASDLMHIVPNIPHLQDIKLAVGYREIPESLPKAPSDWGCKKWKQDPDADRYLPWAPRYKYYINGKLVGEQLPTTSRTSKTPFPEARVPRRGLTQVYPDDPDYNRICKEQGLEHLIKGEDQSPPPLANGIHSSPTSQKSIMLSRPTINGTNGHTVSESADDHAPTTNGDIPNGVNGSSN